MAETQRTATVQCGREITVTDIELIRETVELFPQLNRTELAATLCEHLEWFTAGGGLKTDACAKLLRKLEAGGWLKLTKRQRGRPVSKPARGITLSGRTDPQPEIVNSLREVGRVRIEMVREEREKALWNEYVERYHPLGYKQPFGYRLRYFISYEGGMLGCVLYSGAAKALRARDGWIGWSEGQRLRNLAWVVNNSRLLILPWVRVRNLASHVLGRLTGRICEDWENRWGYRPVLLETFVDPRQHEGSCYRAAGWHYLGMTTGTGLVREGKSYTTSPKKIFVKPLAEDFRRRLCSEQLVGRIER